MTTPFGRVAVVLTVLLREFAIPDEHHAGAKMHPARPLARHWRDLEDATPA